MTPAGIEPATFRFVAQCLSHCATAAPCYNIYPQKCIDCDLCENQHTECHRLVGSLHDLLNPLSIVVVPLGLRLVCDIGSGVPRNFVRGVNKFS